VCHDSSTEWGGPGLEDACPLLLSALVFSVVFGNENASPREEIIFSGEARLACDENTFFRLFRFWAERVKNVDAVSCAESAFY